MRMSGAHALGIIIEIVILSAGGLKLAAGVEGPL